MIFWRKKFDSADFQFCEMDTDSAYLALSAPMLIDVIKPYMLPAYTNGLEGYCRNEIVEAMPRYIGFFVLVQFSISTREHPDYSN